MRQFTTEARSVGPHLYSQFDTIEWPFVATRAFSRTGIGIDQFELTGLPPDEDFTVDGEFMEIIQAFELDLRLLDWLGLEIELGGSALTGIDANGALFVGMNGVAGLRVSGVAQLVKTDLLLLSARLDLTGRGGLGIQPARVVSAFTADGTEPVSSIDPSFDANISGIGGSLAAALTATDWLGFMGSIVIEGRRVEIDDVSDNEGTLAGAVGASFNFGPLGVPFQLLVATRVAWNFGDDFRDIALAASEPVDDVVVSPELGFYYTDPRRPNLELGVSFRGGFTDISERGSLAVSLGYWW
jgi:hypothetical protein